MRISDWSSDVCSSDLYVLLQAAQRVAAAVDRGVGEHSGGLLEGGRREPRLRGQLCLGDTHQLRTSRWRLATDRKSVVKGNRCARQVYTGGGRMIRKNTEGDES